MKRAYYYIGAVVIGILCLVLRGPRIQKEHEINKLKLEKEKIVAEISGLNSELDTLKDTREMYCGENSILKASGDVLRSEIVELENGISDIDNKLITMLGIKLPTIQEDDNDLTGVIYDSSGLWRVNSEGKRHKLYTLQGKTVQERAKSLLDKFGIGYTINTWYAMTHQYNIKAEVAICIAFADTSLGAQTKTTNNIGNIGNNDRGDKVYFNSLDGGIEAIFKTLNNNYFIGYDTIGMLSQGGRTHLQARGCGEKGEYCYATSPENRNNNIINCLNLLYWHEDITIDENFEFRIK